MDIHPDAAAMSNMSPLAGNDSLSGGPASPMGGGKAGDHRRVDELHLRARLLKMIVSNEQQRRPSSDSSASR